MKNIALLLILGTLISCQNNYSDNYVDAIYHNGTIYQVDGSFSIAQSMVVKDGKIFAIGTEDEIDDLNLKPGSIIDLKGQYVYPGLIDAHCHFYRMGQQLQQVDLIGTTSYQEVLDKVQEFQKVNNKAFIIGRGWDQNDWDVKEFPTNEELNDLFPNTPVALTRVDGHAMIVNDAALRMANIDVNTPFSGGDIEQKNGVLTGILVDNPMKLIIDQFPAASVQDDIDALLDAQAINFSYGLTTVDDAGLDRDIIELIDSLQQAGSLKMKVYAMVSNSPENLDYYLDQKGIVKTDRLNVRSVKFYADGALGSRGAAMKEPYSDREDHFGALLSSVEDFKKTAKRIAATDFQMNTHAIGDSANVVVLKTYRELLNDMPDRRWRVEHAQVISPEDFQYFDRDRILPSVQPTHATSDMYWAQDRVGAERIKGAYAYQRLLQQSGMLALGTDYPVEQVNPFLTFYAAVTRQDTTGYPDGGFTPQETLSRMDALRGMTIWAAYSNFEENEKGSLEKGKSADFMILPQDLMNMPIQDVPNIKVSATFINGEKVY